MERGIHDTANVLLAATERMVESNDLLTEQSKKTLDASMGLASQFEGVSERLESGSQMSAPVVLSLEQEEAALTLRLGEVKELRRREAKKLAKQRLIEQISLRKINAEREAKEEQRLRDKAERVRFEAAATTERLRVEAAAKKVREQDEEDRRAMMEMDSEDENM